MLLVCFFCSFQSCEHFLFLHQAVLQSVDVLPEAEMSWTLLLSSHPSSKVRRWQVSLRTQRIFFKFWGSTVSWCWVKFTFCSLKMFTIRIFLKTKGLLPAWRWILCCSFLSYRKVSIKCWFCLNRLQFQLEVSDLLQNAVVLFFFPPLWKCGNGCGDTCITVSS